MMHEDEDATLVVLSSHRAIIDDIITAGRGHVSGSAGDSVLAEFPSIIDAVNCGVLIQRALAKANAALPPERRMELRIGINVGDVMVKDGGVFGDGVNVAARLEGLAEPGGILVTRSVRDQVRDRVDYDFDDLGEQSVKNIARPLRVFRVVFDPGAPAAQSPAPRGPAAADVESGAAADLGAVELAFWRSVEARDAPVEYHAYLERYPSGSFALLAQARLVRGGSKTAGKPPAAPCSPPTRGPAVVLVVENDPLVRALAVDVLEEAGFEVIEASSADYAVIVLEKRPDVRVVFTDVEMPGKLDGIQLARIVQHRYQRAGVVVGSGRERPTPSELSPDAAFLAKPYAPATLVDAIRRLAA